MSSYFKIIYTRESFSPYITNWAERTDEQMAWPSGLKNMVGQWPNKTKDSFSWQQKRFYSKKGKFAFSIDLYKTMKIIQQITWNIKTNFDIAYKWDITSRWYYARNIYDVLVTHGYTYPLYIDG